MSISFDSPAYLVLLAILPGVWWVARRSLVHASTAQRWLSIIVRSLVCAGLILAVAGLHWVWRDDRLSVLLLVDRSASLATDDRASEPALVAQLAGTQASRRPHDRAGLIVFGREAVVEVPPSEGSTLAAPRIESVVDRDRTNLATAIRLARATLTAVGARRLVIVSDGNQNLGDALAEAQAAAEAGIGIDVVPLASLSSADVSVDRLTAPTAVRPDEPFELRVVLTNFVGAGNPGPTEGRLRITRRASGGEQIVSDQHVALPAGTRAFTIRQQTALADFHSYEAQFIADDPLRDTATQDNRATAFTQVVGRGRVLLLENAVETGQFASLAARLRADGIEVDSRPSTAWPTSIAELQAFDAVVLADVPREADDGLARGPISDEQIAMLVHNTHDLASGLLLLGGPHALGAGGWAGTELERAMPVDFRISNAEVQPIGALALVIDRSSSMQGEKIAMARAAAVEAVQQLGPLDLVCVVSFDAASELTVPLTTAAKSRTITNAIARIESNGGTNLAPAMHIAYGQLRDAAAAAKHMILLTDGQTAPADTCELVERMAAERITVSAVALGHDAAAPLLTDLARLGGGRYYAVEAAGDIPRIFAREARRVARPLVFEDPHGFRPSLGTPHEITRGLESPLPPLTGLVLTTPKAGSLVEVPIISPQPDQGRPVLAAWTFGSGRAVVWTTDLGARWAKAWAEWPGHGKLMLQLVRWAMRPIEENRSLAMNVELRDDEGIVMVTPTTSERAAESLVMTATLLRPNLTSSTLRVEPTASGGYVARFPATEVGNYFVSMSPGPGQPPLRTGLAVPSSPEYREHETNLALLTSLAALRPTGGEPGRVIEPPPANDKNWQAAADAFRHDLAGTVERQEAWHLLVFAAALLFVVDAAVRRVAFSTAGVGKLARRVFGGWQLARVAPPSDPTLDRLRSRKAELASGMDSRAGWLPEAANTAPIDTPAEAVEMAQAAASAAKTDLPEDEGGSLARLLQLKRNLRQRASNDHE